jgi:hypothetical protein
VCNSELCECIRRNKSNHPIQNLSSKSCNNHYMWLPFLLGDIPLWLHYGPPLHFWHHILYYLDFSFGNFWIGCECHTHVHQGYPILIHFILFFGDTWRYWCTSSTHNKAIQNFLLHSWNHLPYDHCHKTQHCASTMKVTLNTLSYNSYFSTFISFLYYIYNLIGNVYEVQLQGNSMSTNLMLILLCVHRLRIRHMFI